MLFQAVLQQIQLVPLHKQVIPPLVLHHQVDLTVIRSGKYNVRVHSVFFQKLHVNVKTDPVNITEQFPVRKHV